MEWIIPSELITVPNQISPGLHNVLKTFLNKNESLFKDKIILDLACHDGNSSRQLIELGAKRLVGVDIRDNLIEIARDSCQGKSAYFFTNDITNYGLIDSLIAESNVVTCFGAFYHLTDNFTFLDHVCQKNVEYVIFETVFGTESPNAFMFPLFENTSINFNGYHPKYSKVPICQPNLSWIYQALNQIGFKIDYIQKYYSSTEWETVPDHEINKRMIIKMYNPNIIKKDTYLNFDDIWQWNDNNLIQQC
jgi:ubiquinone/menaquinone biosynthesis C-methylase UbiE